MRVYTISQKFKHKQQKCQNVGPESKKNTNYTLGLKLLTIAPYSRSIFLSLLVPVFRSKLRRLPPVFTSYLNSLILPCHQVCRRPSGPSQKTGAAENAAAAAAARSSSRWAIRAAQRRGPTSSVRRIHETPQLACRPPYCSCIIAHLLARSS
jgi:hypothetical protein